ncbi:MAG: redox-active protein [Paludibacteraceae bacterium]|nr:redox-active protein [Paludibacteraceae bacterium]MBR4840655.1 redox-active protein [Paludibacteraceae bacterium]
MEKERECSAVYFHRPPESLNCAQSIMKGFQKEFQVSDAEIEEFRAWGGGRAEGGLCGALFAADTLLKRRGLGSIASGFEKRVGYKTCKEIKGKACSCPDCVRIADELLSEVMEGAGE